MFSINAWIKWDFSSGIQAFQGLPLTQLTLTSNFWHLIGQDFLSILSRWRNYSTFLFCTHSRLAIHKSALKSKFYSRKPSSGYPCSHPCIIPLLLLITRQDFQNWNYKISKHLSANHTKWSKWSNTSKQFGWCLPQCNATRTRKLSLKKSFTLIDLKHPHTLTVYTKPTTLLHLVILKPIKQCH